MDASHMEVDPSSDHNSISPKLLNLPLEIIHDTVLQNKDVPANKLQKLEGPIAEAADTRNVIFSLFNYSQNDLSFREVELTRFPGIHLERLIVTSVDMSPHAVKLIRAPGAP